MTNEEKIKALAELDGWTPGEFRTFGFGCDGMAMGNVLGWWKEPHVDARNFTDKLPDYLTSYDAIIPLIQRQEHRVIMDINNYLVNGHGTTSGVLYSTPTQLCDALLIATGKMKV